MTNALEQLFEKLQELALLVEKPAHYEIPSLWLMPGLGSGTKQIVEPFSFFRDRVGEILSSPDESPRNTHSLGEWSRYAVVYNMFLRHTTAFDHNGNGKLDLPLNEDGFRETGSFLKAIALLPYIKYMGCNTIHLLPITAIGRDGKKGTLGSPYAIRNPYKIDENLAEPILSLGAGIELGAFIEAAHRLGMRVVLEFVFRTASIDADWIPEHPNWFYWIQADIPNRTGETPPNTQTYGSPYFDEDELRMIQLRVKRNDFSSLPPPNLDYRRMFQDYPLDVELVDGKYIGKSDKGTLLRIPGAFADWPPMDVQPPWDDVTYLKLYDDDRFNYIAYNTIRMYDTRLTTKENENRALWNTIINIIPHFQKHFGIDGVMIDMGHALPPNLKQTLIERARKNNSDFAFWEENFSINAKSKLEGYNASVGYLPFDEHDPGKLRAFITERATQGTPIAYFCTPENHNTPRAASRQHGIIYSKLAWVINNFLPGIPYIHQGYELGERLPVNTGLDFTPEDIEQFPSEQLPLFSEGQLCWLHENEFTSFIHKISEIRKEFGKPISDFKPQTFHILPTSNDNILAFFRSTRDDTQRIGIFANLNCVENVQARFIVPSIANIFHDDISKMDIPINNNIIEYEFEPGQCLVGRLIPEPKPEPEVEEVQPEPKKVQIRITN